MPFRDRANAVRLPAGTAIHLHPGIPFPFSPERRSRSPRNDIHLRPESAVEKQIELLKRNRAIHDAEIAELFELQRRNEVSISELLQSINHVSNPADTTERTNEGEGRQA